MVSPDPTDAPPAATRPAPSTARLALETVGWALGQGPRLLRNNLAGFSPAWIQRFVFGADSLAERAQLLVTPVTVDPRVLQRFAQSFAHGFFVAGSGAFAVVGAFDPFIRASTLLRARGERTTELFFRMTQGSTFTAEPRVYGACPFGVWEERVAVEPHVTCRAAFPAQVAGVEQLVDDFLAPHVDTVVEVGELVRPLVWDALLLTSYGVQPSDATRRILAAFEAHAPEFDTSLRVQVGPRAPAWSDELKALVKEMDDWTWKTTLERQAELAADSDAVQSRTDVLSYALTHEKPDDLRAFDGALKALFTAGFNNTHCAVAGALVANAVHDDLAHTYIDSDSREPDAEIRLEHVVRETLRLHTAIPVGRTVQQEDEFDLGGTRLADGASVILPTVAVNTDPGAWAEPQTFDPARFAGRDEMAYMCGPGFAPFGAANELGGRQCAGRFYIVHILKALLGKMLRDYTMTRVGRGFFDFKQMIGSSQYSGHCKVHVERRVKE